MTASPSAPTGEPAGRSSRIFFRGASRHSARMPPRPSDPIPRLVRLLPRGNGFSLDSAPHRPKLRTGYEGNPEGPAVPVASLAPSAGDSGDPPGGRIPRNGSGVLPHFCSTADAFRANRGVAFMVDPGGLSEKGCGVFGPHSAASSDRSRTGAAVAIQLSGVPMCTVRAVRVWRSLAAVGAGLAMTALLGCGGGDSSKATVSGKIAYKGVPLTSGTLSLYPASG